ncbi:MAG: hypothetical protein SA378_06000 [Sedimentibacter sp.]|uniref:hypothetical protein n=1 Tax=Sedimentibacter sp. TaxID=1960295 RepID=UPI0029827128|nr:hypothetical protein [Sedimentibacter sp.]MDW5299671.1 hypothetical protein [Sedimentibacter sp.]
MIMLKRMLFFILCFFMFNSQAYGFAKIMESPNDYEIKNNIEEKYGINIIINVEDEELDSTECIFVLEQSLRRFPEGVIKEITDFYNKNGISTNVIINETEIIMDLFSEYSLTNESANIYINALQSSLYSDVCIASEESLVHELGHFVSDYLYKVYGYEKLKADFENFNKGYEYGLWGEGYSDVFINKHSAMNFIDEVADLIWYAEVHPEILRNISEGETEIIHEKVRFLADVFNKCFISITEDSRLWMEAVPQKPDDWAVESICAMKNESLIPEKFEGMYDAYITRENFYSVVLNIIEKKLGEEAFNKSSNIVLQEEHFILDPVRGEILVDDGMSHMFTDVLLCSNKVIMYEVYQMGLINHDGMILPPEGHMTRLEIAKLFTYIANELGMDISDYSVVYYNDISNVKDSEKPFIYFVSSTGIMRGYCNSFKPYDYCTYQEAYIMLMRLYNIL